MVLLSEQKCRTENLSADEISDLIKTSAGFSGERADLIDDDSSSGDDAPPAQPNCERAISPAVIDHGSGAGSER